MPNIKVAPSIFELEASFRRGIVVAVGLQNHGLDRALDDLLQGAVAQAVKEPIDLANDKRVMSWVEAHRRFGSNPNRFPPAHLALRKRVQKPGWHAPFINKVVAVMSVTSILDVVPVGGDNVGDLGEDGEIALRRATGEERFVPLGQADQEERPEPGEVIYVVGEAVACRRWNWRNGHPTRVTDETRSIVMNVDALGEDSESRAIFTRDRVARLLEEHCEATVRTALLSPSHPEFQFSV